MSNGFTVPVILSAAEKRHEERCMQLISQLSDGGLQSLQHRVIDLLWKRRLNSQIQASSASSSSSASLKVPVKTSAADSKETNQNNKRKPSRKSRSGQKKRRISGSNQQPQKQHSGGGGRVKFEDMKSDFSVSVEPFQLKPSRTVKRSTSASSTTSMNTRSRTRQNSNDSPYDANWKEPGDRCPQNNNKFLYSQNLRPETPYEQSELSAFKTTFEMSPSLGYHGEFNQYGSMAKEFVNNNSPSMSMSPPTERDTASKTKKKPVITKRNKTRQSRSKRNSRK